MVYWILQVIEFLGIAFAFSAFIIGWLFAWKGSLVQYKLLIWLVSLRFFVEFVGDIWSIQTQTSNNWMYNLYFPLESLGFLYIFYLGAIHTAVKRINAALLIAILPTLLVAYILYPGFTFLNTHAIIYQSFLLLVSAGCAFIDILLDKSRVQFVRRPLFWLASGIIIYSGASIMVYLFWAYGKKMILYLPFAYIYMISYNLLSFFIIGSFISIRRATADKFRVV